MQILGWGVVVAIGFVAVVFVVDWLTDDGDPDFHSETDSNIGRTHDAEWPYAPTGLREESERRHAHPE